MRMWAMVALGIVFLPAARVCAQAEVVKLRPGDAIRIEVKDEPQFTAEFPVGLDGNIMLPLIGTIGVANRDFLQVDSALRSQIAREFKDPVIRITPLLRVSVLGEVRVPGVFLIDATFTAAEILARAGGLTPQARENGIVVRRPDGEVSARFSLTNAAQQTNIKSGDQVFVARQNWISSNLGIFLSAAGSVAVALVTAAVVR
jgi:polysaccharide biosynthesis/export protein